MSVAGSIGESRRELVDLGSDRVRLQSRADDLDLDIGKAIRRARARRMRVDEIAVALGVSRPTVYRLQERAERENGAS